MSIYTDKKLMAAIRGFALVLIFSSAFSARARISPAWVESPAYAPNIKVLIHQSSVGGPASSFSVQKHSATDPKIQALLKNLAAPENFYEELLPHKCYRLKREKMSSRQTWCEADGSVYAFVEIGPQQLKENEFVQLVLGTLQVRK